MRDEFEGCKIRKATCAECGSKLGKSAKYDTCQRCTRSIRVFTRESCAK